MNRQGVLWTEKEESPGREPRAKKRNQQHQCTIPLCDIKHISSNRVKSTVSHEIEFYNEGILSRAGVHIGNPTGKGRGKRSKVSGWSRQSRRRFRRAILQLHPGEGYYCYGVTLTVPGPSDFLMTKKAFESFKRKLERINCTGFWRIEIQERGALHYHLLLYVPESSFPEYKKRGYVIKGIEDHHQIAHTVLGKKWLKSLHKMGECLHTLKNGRKVIAYRDHLPGAYQYAFQMGRDTGNQGAWLRYLQDHATKSKQEQVPVDIGRHWGYIGRPLLKRKPPDMLYDMTEKQFHAYKRMHQRLIVPRILDTRCPFGSRKGFKTTRGAKGQAVWFCNPETIKRIADWAITSRRGGHEHFSPSLTSSWEG